MLGGMEERTRGAVNKELGRKEFGQDDCGHLMNGQNMALIAFMGKGAPKTWGLKKNRAEKCGTDSFLAWLQ